MIGKRRHRFRLQENTGTSPNSYGEPVPVWTTQATRWGSLESVAGEEFFDGNRIQANVTHQIEMRRYQGLTPKWRLNMAATGSDSERIFNIQAILDVDNRKHTVKIRVKEVVV